MIINLTKAITVVLMYYILLTYKGTKIRHMTSQNYVMCTSYHTSLNPRTNIGIRIAYRITSVMLVYFS